MLLRLLDEPKTDIIGALEAKLEDNPLVAKFYEDVRVHNALFIYNHSEWDLSLGMKNICNQFDYLDDTWVMTYLLKSIGRVPEANAIRRIFHKGYDPFKSYNPVVKGFAYVEAIETCSSTSEMHDLAASMEYHVGQQDDPILQRFYPILGPLFQRRLKFIERSEYHVAHCMKEIDSFVGEGDSLVSGGEYTRAFELYRDASDIARYQLRNDGLARDLYDRVFHKQIEIFTEEGDKLALEEDFKGAEQLYSAAARLALEKLGDRSLADEIAVRADSLHSYLEDTVPDMIVPDFEEVKSRNPLRYIARGVGRLYDGIRKRFQKKAA